MTTQTNTATNTGLTLEGFIKELGKLGAQDGKGRAARVHAFVRGVEAAAKIPGVGPANAKEYWQAYATEAAKNQGKEFSVGTSYDVQVSKFRRSLDLGALPGIDPIDMIYRAVDILQHEMAKDDSGVKGSTYDNLVRVARAQIARPDKALTDREILDEVIKETPEKDDAQKLADLYKRTYKLHKDMPATSPARVHVAASLNAIEDALHAIDEDVPAVTKEERAVASVLKRAEKLKLKLVKTDA